MPDANSNPAPPPSRDASPSPRAKAAPPARVVIAPSALGTTGGLRLPQGLRLAISRTPRRPSSKDTAMTTNNPADRREPSAAQTAPARSAVGTLARPASETPRDTTPEPAPTNTRGGRGLSDEIFISPRVVDERSFDDLAGTLRTLVSQAQTQSQVLAGSATEVKALSDQLRGATKELWSRVEATSKLVPGIDQRVGKVEKILATINQDLTSRIETYRQLTSNPIDEAAIAERAKAAALAAIDQLAQGHIGVAVAQGVATITTAGEHASTTAQQQTQALEALVREAQRSLAEREAEMLARVERSAETSRRAIEALLDEAVTRIETRSNEAAARIEAQLKHAESQSMAREKELNDLLSATVVAEDRLSASIAQQEAAQARAAEQSTRAEADADALTTRLGAALSEAARRGDALDASVRTRLDALTDAAATLETRATSIEGVFEPLRQASALIERAEEAGQRLTLVEARVSEHHQRAEAALRDTTAIASQADLARSQLARAIIEGSEAIDAMETRIADAVATLQNHNGMHATANLAETLEKSMQIGNALAQLAARAETLAQRLGR